MKRRIHHTVASEADLIGIWHFTCERWGAGQADAYLLELEEGIQALANSPDMGASREIVRSGCRVLLLNSHAVYYTSSAVEIRIIRVLHGNMDPAAYL